MKTLEQFQKYTLLVTIFLMPLAFTRLFVAGADTSKIILLALGVSLSLILVALKTFLSGKLSLYTSKFDLLVLFLALTYLASGLLRTPNKMEAFFLPGTASIIILGAILYFLTQWSFGAQKKPVSMAVFFSGVALSIFSLISFAGILAKIPQLPQILKDANFSFTGGKLAEAIFLTTLVPLGSTLTISQREIIKKVFFGVALSVLALSLLLSISQLLPGKPASPALPSLGTSWWVSVEAVKNSPLLGIGPGNYLTAFTRFKPLSYNAGPLWNIRFTTARNFPLTLLTEVGLLGMFLYAVIAFRIILLALKDYKSGPLLSLILLFILTFVFPAATTLLILFFVLLSLTVSSREVSFSLTAAGANDKTLSTRFPAILLGLAAVAVTLVFDFFVVRAVRAEYSYKKAIDHLIKNEGKQTYDTLTAAIRLNPRIDRYHSSLAQVNLALAISLANLPTQTGRQLTEDERKTISQLLAQAINEGKATIALNPGRSGNWEVLARIYRTVMPFAQGADNFAIQTYFQAVSLDPINPNLRIALGGVYYALGRYDDAIDTFKLATLAKPDLANAHYNLSAAYREKKDYDRAITEMNAVLSLVQKDSNDYRLAQKELENLQLLKPAPTTKAEASQAETLTPPQPAPQPVIKPPLELPEEATPPATNQ